MIIFQPYIILNTRLFSSTITFNHTTLIGGEQKNSNDTYDT